MKTSLVMCVTIYTVTIWDLPIAAQPAPAIKENTGFKPLELKFSTCAEYTKRILTSTLFTDILLQDTMTTSLLLLCMMLHSSDLGNLGKKTTSSDASASKGRVM